VDVGASQLIPDVSRTDFVAKGNDGNYLQHSIEVSAAAQLASRDETGRLHVAFAHGMAPFESSDQPKNPPARGLLLHALNESYGAPKEGEQQIVSAYRRCGATLSRYPNSAELLRSVIGADRLAGGITEVEPAKYALLARAWSGSRVVAVNSSWRSQIEPGGVLACPAGLETPWLVTLDPMTYCDSGFVDDDSMYPDDLEGLSNLLIPYITTGQPGIAALFVYSVRPEVRPQFWQFVHKLGERVDADLVSCWVTHRGGNRNLGGLLCSGLTYSVFPNGVRFGQE
jgi:hypothetical protein